MMTSFNWMLGSFVNSIILLKDCLVYSLSPCPLKCIMLITADHSNSNWVLGHLPSIYLFPLDELLLIVIIEEYQCGILD
jgi:hypothetical protein